MNNEHVDRLEEALRSVVEAAIAKQLGLAEYEHAILWWEPYSNTSSTGRTELRKATDYRSVGRMLFADPAMKQLRAVANDIRKIKWPEFLLDPTAENLCECYFSTIGSVAIDEAALRRIAEKYVTDVQADDFVYVTVFQVSNFSATEAFQLDDNIDFRPIADADIEHFSYEPLPVRQSPRLKSEIGSAQFPKPIVRILEKAVFKGSNLIVAVQGFVQRNPHAMTSKEKESFLSEDREYLGPVEDMTEVVKVLKIVTDPLHNAVLERLDSAILSDGEVFTTALLAAAGKFSEMTNHAQLIAALQRLVDDIESGKDPLDLDTYWEVYGNIKSGRGRKIRSIICSSFLEYFRGNARRLEWEENAQVYE